MIHGSIKLMFIEIDCDKCDYRMRVIVRFLVLAAFFHMLLSCHWTWKLYTYIFCVAQIISQPRTDGRNRVHLRAWNTATHSNVRRFRFVHFICFQVKSCNYLLSGRRTDYLPNNDNLKPHRQLIRTIKSIMRCLANIFVFFFCISLKLGVSALRNGNVLSSTFPFRGA